jgi:hypothetical protein
MWFWGREEGIPANLQTQIGLLAGIEMIVEGLDGGQPEYWQRQTWSKATRWRWIIVDRRDVG